jgi:uncharacterized protein (TIGR02300 family)
MTKPELGTKRLCVHCGAKFYDLNHAPINCPKCGAVFEAAVASSRGRPGAARAPVREVERALAETQEAKFVSPENADAVFQSKRNAPEAGDEAEVDDENLDDAAFIEEKEDTDVAEIIGGDIEIEKGT